MKRLLVILLALTLIGSQSVAFATGAATAGGAPDGSPTELVIGSTTPMSGTFYSDLWGMNTSDMDARGILHGYSTIAWLRSGDYAVDATVCTMTTSQFAGNGNKVYTFTLSPNLVWNNGTRITAKDYVFTLMLQNAPEMIELGANNETHSYLLGWDAFAEDSTDPFAGVRLLGDYSFSLTVRGDYLPYFYELALVNVAPTPMAVIAPELDIADDGAGAYFMTANPAAPIPFNADILRETLLGEEGYVRKPTVTCGPYDFVSFDPVESVLVVKRNPYYAGNFEGKIPEMEKLTFRAVQNDTMLAALAEGSVDILNKVSKGSVIAEALELVNAGAARSVNYLRNGFGFVAFACEQEPTSDVNVRKAIMMCLDSTALCNETMEGYALPVYGYYGMGQWMASEDTALLEQFNVYGYDPVGAAELLSRAGWQYNPQGAQFDPAVDQVRCKAANNVLIPLTLNWAKVSGSTGVDWLELQLTQAAQTLGFQLNIHEMSFTDMLSQYYRQTERTDNLFFLASNFNHIFDPYFTYHIDDEYQGEQNRSGLRDEQLMRLADRMRRLEPGDTATYKERWMLFQQRWVELLPMAPLYSNVYFDVYRPDLYGYAINNSWGWSAAILYASFDPAADAIFTITGDAQTAPGQTGNTILIP